MSANYLRNSWYAAGWSSELNDKPIARTILGDPVVLFRGSDGNAAALYDACPHRFAPLSLGKVKGDVIACGYHGLEFSRTGACVRNPHGKGVIPAALGVRSYPMTERYGMLWIWTGAPELADPALLPDLSAFDEAEYEWVYGKVDVTANYELVIDNLLDLTHVEFLHPFLASEGGSERTTFRSEQVGDRITSYYVATNEPVSGLFSLLHDGDEKFSDFLVEMHWLAPSNLYLLNALHISGQPSEKDVRLPVMHLLTPETEDSTHYFWAVGRNRQHGNEEVSNMLGFGTQSAFENEDEPMIRAARSRMRSNDLFAHKPALLPFDESGVRARRTLKRLIDAESARTKEVA